MSRTRLGVLISGRGSNLQALIDASAQPEYPATVAAVVSNAPDAYGLVRARKHGIETAVFEHRSYADRAAFETAITDFLERREIEVVCLAGFMRILTATFVTRWCNRLINIHPSLLPAYRGLNTHERVLAAGEGEHGCTVHLVRPELDSGPLLLQAKTPVRPDDNAETLAARVLELEHLIYPRAVAWLSEGRVAVRDDRAFVDGRQCPIMLDEAGHESEVRSSGNR